MFCRPDLKNAKDCYAYLKFLDLPEAGTEPAILVRQLLLHERTCYFCGSYFQWQLLSCVPHECFQEHIGFTPCKARYPNLQAMCAQGEKEMMAGGGCSEWESCTMPISPSSSYLLSFMHEFESQVLEWPIPFSPLLHCPTKPAWEDCWKLGEDPSNHPKYQSIILQSNYPSHH